MKDLTVFVLTHNRGPLLLETIQSVLNQSCNDFKFVVSDNSSNEETYKLLIENNLLEKIEYRKRDREYPSFDHFNICISEVDTKYFVLFHDDDIMLPRYVETMYNTIREKNCVAVGCNSFILYGTKRTKNSYLKIKKNLEICTKEELVGQYLLDNIVPFPSYIYNSEIIKPNRLYFYNNVGKYSDVTWLLKILSFGYINWINDELMYYRIHDKQDSQNIDFFNQIKLFSVFKKICYNNNKMKQRLNKRRIRFLYSYESSRKNNYRNWKLYFKYSFIYLFPRILIKRIVREL